MSENNTLYPYGSGYESYDEYHLTCPQCGKQITCLLPVEPFRYSMKSAGTACHSIDKMIQRGNTDYFPHKMIKFRDDAMGGGHIDDFYNLYPILKGESPEERRKRLIQIKLSELTERLTFDPAKKEQIVTELAERNDTILNALDPILKEYEKTPREKWPELDARIRMVTPENSAVDLIRRFALKPTYSSAVQDNPAGLQVDMNLFNSFNSNPDFGMTSSEFTGTSSSAIPGTTSSAADSWTCASCGAVSSGKFCMTCGMPRPAK